MSVLPRSPVAAKITSQNSVVQPNSPRCSYAQSSAAPLIVTLLSHVKSSNTECTGYVVNSVPRRPSSLKVHTSSVGRAESLAVLEGRRITPPAVW